MTPHRDTLVLTRSEAAGLLHPLSLADGIEQAFREHAQGSGLPLIREHLAGRGGAFHVVAGGVDLGEPWFTAKVNAHFGAPGGVTALFSAADGRLVALLDSAHLTVARTAAMTVVVIRALGYGDAERALVVGGGRQGAAQARVLRETLPRLRSLLVHDHDEPTAARAAQEAGGGVALDLATAAREAEVIVTATPARRPFLDTSMVAPGALVCAYGADAPGKQEVELELVQASRVVVDVKAQAIASGELQHAANAGLDQVIERAQELGAILAEGPRRREREAVPVLYDATGTALQDAVAAARLVRAANAAGRGLHVALDG